MVELISISMSFMNTMNKPSGTIWISTITEHKHLGLQLSDDDNWNKHIDMITKKAFSRVNILRKFKFILDRKTLETIYITFIRPLLEYDWIVLCLSLLSFNFSHPVSIYRLLKDTSLVPPVTILAASTWTFSSLLISISVLVSQTTSAYSSNGRTRTSLYASYFIPSSVQLWNQQPENIKSSRSVQIIKWNLQPQNNTKPIYYYIARLRIYLYLGYSLSL
jgi:hypothetical protein